MELTHIGTSTGITTTVIFSTESEQWIKFSFFRAISSSNVEKTLKIFAALKTGISIVVGLSNRYLRLPYSVLDANQYEAL